MEHEKDNATCNGRAFAFHQTDSRLVIGYPDCESEAIYYRGTVVESSSPWLKIKNGKERHGDLNKTSV